MDHTTLQTHHQLPLHLPPTVIPEADFRWNQVAWGFELSHNVHPQMTTQASGCPGRPVGQV